MVGFTWAEVHMKLKSASESVSRSPFCKNVARTSPKSPFAGTQNVKTPSPSDLEDDVAVVVTERVVCDVGISAPAPSDSDSSSVDTG